MKLYRLLQLMNMLVNSDKTTIKNLSEELEVSKRTIYRDLETLSMAGFPIVSTPGFGGGISITEGYKFDKRLLSTEDWEHIITGLNAIKTMGDTEKIEFLIGRIAPRNIETINEQSDIIIDLSQWYDDDTQELIINLRNAISNKRLITIDYQTKASTTNRTIEPYKLVFKEKDWYVYAYCRLRDGFRLFKINRISSYEIMADNYIPRKIELPAFDFVNERQVYQKDVTPTYRVILEFDLGDKEFLIETLGALNFKIRENNGIIDFQTTNLDYAANLIISLQDKVKVVSPSDLCDRVYSLICKMKKLYER